MNIVLWILAILLIVVGVAGVVLPALPGAVLVFAGIALAAWIDDFARVSAWTVGVTGFLMALAWASDYVAALLGAKKVGASKQAIVGAAVGTLAGIFTGLWGLVFMPLVGAAIGEYMAHPELARAGKVGVATWIGMAVGVVAKVVIVFVMLGIFVADLLL
ncbi:MAG: DUF456 family protein [Burkholderiales bacterium]|jgi:hypothetical protein|nr:DUF456 family protein [Burkholderiales bacterium]